jgi:hypothetical protein
MYERIVRLRIELCSYISYTTCKSKTVPIREWSILIRTELRSRKFSLAWAGGEGGGREKIKERGKQTKRN